MLLKTLTILESRTCEPADELGKVILNSVALVRERTIPTEQPPLVGEVSANFADRGVSRGQRNGSPRQF